jgi:hypothetical protein
MSNHSEGDFGQIELDAAERADAEINLDDPSAGDDEPWSPPDRQPRGAEMAEVEDETLSMRVRQEEPDPTAAVDPDEEPQLGGGDPDAIPADEDVLGGDSYGEDDSIDLDDESGPEAGAMHLES